MENGSSAFEEVDIIETTDEDGKVHIFEKISEIEIDGQDYALLIYKGGDEGEETEESMEGHDEEVVVMKISEEDGLEVYEAIEDEAEFERVVAYIEQMDDEDSPVSIDLGNFVTDIGEDEVKKN